MPEIRRADRADNDELLRLARATPMPGVIGLRIDRDPDFFRLLSLRGESSLFVREGNGEIQGCISLSRRAVWAAGAERELWYVGDMKVRPDVRERGVGASLATAAFDYLSARGGDLLTCVVARGNRRVLSFLEGKHQIPPFRSLGSLSVLMVLSSGRRPGGRYRVREAAPGDAAELADIYRTTVPRFELAPVLEEDDWRRAIDEDPSLCQVLVAEREGRAHAAGWLFDVQWAKQHVVTALPRGLSVGTALLRPLGGLSRAFRIPGEGDAVPLLCLRHIALMGDDLEALRSLVQGARVRARAGGFPFVLYGLHERDPWRGAFRRFPRFTMGSELFFTSLKGDWPLVDEVARGVPVEDYALT